MFKFNDKEIKILLNNLVIVVDKREQVNLHIKDYFDKKKIKYIDKSIDAADYTCYIESNEETKELIGNRNMWFDNIIAIERKAHVDELSQSIKDRQRFQYEFMRLKNANTKIVLLVEDGNGYENILLGKYRSQYEPKAFLSSLKAFEARFNFNTIFLDKKYSGNFIYHTLLFHVREYLKTY